MFEWTNDLPRQTRNQQFHPNVPPTHEFRLWRLGTRVVSSQKRIQLAITAIVADACHRDLESRRTDGSQL